jgi:hypothetical protein
MYLTKDGRVFTVSDIRGMDEKTPLPRTQQTAMKDPVFPSSQQNGAIVETQKTTAAAAKVSAIFGGLGLFCVLIGWRKFRGLRRPRS